MNPLFAFVILSLNLLHIDIRTLYILFLLSFVDQGTPSNVKSAFLEQRRDTFAGLFKGLQQDPYPVIQRVLETFWNGIWSDPKVKRTLKVGLFNEGSITQVGPLILGVVHYTGTEVIAR